MKTFLICLFGSSLVQLSSLSVSAQPANDNFANREKLTGPVLSVAGSNEGAGTEFGEPTGSGFFRYGATVWYSWTAPASAPVRVDTIGSTFNTILAVFTGTSVTGLTQVVQNDNAPELGMLSLVTFNAQSGVEYQIQVAGAPSFGPGGFVIAAGSIQLNLRMSPSVAITSPANGAVFMAGTNIVLNATASSPVGSVERVDFYRGGVFLGSDTTAPYSVVASETPPGTNSFYAAVTDSVGLVSTSAVVNVAALNWGLTLVLPVDGSTYLNTNPITVRAVAMLQSGAMTNVSFYVDGAQYANDRTVPYNGQWFWVTPGPHKFVAIGKDNAGLSHTSAPIVIAVASPLTPGNEPWKYLDTGEDLGSAWVALDFNDSAWASGFAPFGYGDASGQWPVTTNSFGSEETNRIATTYFRREFVAANPADFTDLYVRAQRDDGIVVYLNGAEVARQNMRSGPVSYNTYALSNVETTDEATWYTTYVSQSFLREGRNVLAVELHQVSPSSSDLWLNLELLGMPVVMRNRAPEVALTSPPANSFFLAPATVQVVAEASDSDGSVAKVEIFYGQTKLGESAGSSGTVMAQNLPVGWHTFTAVATDNEMGKRTSEPLTVNVSEAGGRWVAFNDHYAGPATHPHATAWNVFDTEGGAPGYEGPLRNIETGTALPANLTLLQFGTAGDSACGAPLPGTPAYDLFNGYADFGSGNLNHAILVTGGSGVLYLFTGLDPRWRYSFRGTVVGGVTDSSNRWTLFSIVGADTFTGAHTANVLTSGALPGVLAEDEAAMNTGDNGAGDVVGWDGISPGPDGSFLVLASQYLGPAPGNATPGPAAYAPVAVRLEEFGPNPLVEISSPPDGYVTQGPTNLVITASASAAGGVAQVLFLANDVVIGSANASPYGVEWNDVPFGMHTLSAVACDREGHCTTSAVVGVTVTIPPTNTVAPTIFAQVPLAETTVTNLTTIQVTFSEPVIGVDAADLLINDTPATQMTGSGTTNFVFTFIQPPYGPVHIRWADLHGITDVGWPAFLSFDPLGAGAQWTYDLIDRTPPVIIAKTPPANAALTGLTRIAVTFSEPVAGVDAADLLVNGTPAYGVSGSGSDYTFAVSQPASGTVNITWALTHGIVDLAPAQNRFNAAGTGGTWNYTLDASTVLFPSNSYWLFLKGTDEASMPSDAWRQPGFDDYGWSNAPAPFFYGDPYSNNVPAYTHLSDMRSNYSTIYLRKQFAVPDVTGITNLFLRAQIDDGMVVWINGVEVLRTNAPAGEVPYDGVATGATFEQNGVPYVNYALLDPRSYLVSGENLIAVHALNESLAQSSDFGFNAQLYTYQTDTELVAPSVVGFDPAPVYVLALTNLAVTFSEPVTGVDATDLLLNGAPALHATSTSNNTVFVFSFPQPPFGPASVIWTADHGITDLDTEPKPFVSALPGATADYVILDGNSPHLVGVTPMAGSAVYDLTQIAVQFSEPVTGVTAADLLINGGAATNVSGAGTDYTFTFAQPAYGTVSIGWATNHGIQDLEMPATEFDPTWPGHTWTYSLVDIIPPVVVARNPPAEASVANLTQLTVTFSEPVSGMNASDLLLNGKAASNVTASNATYTFTFAQPNASVINVTWAANHGITDRATVGNPFDASASGATWSYETVDNVEPTLALISPPPSGGAVRSLRQVTLTFDEPVQGVTAYSLVMNGEPADQMSGSGAGPYKFIYPQPATGVVEISLSGRITDLAARPNDYEGTNWIYVLDTNLPIATLERGPYLQLGTPTSMVVRWRTGTGTDSRVRYGLAPSALTLTAEDPVLTTEHIVALSDLTPYTQYFYSIGSSEGDLTNGVDFCFRTHPTNPIPTRIFFVSDYGLGNADEAAVRDSYFTYTAAEKPADVWITGGDNDQIAGQDASYSTTVFGTTYAYGALLRQLPAWPTIGNHDYQTSQGAAYYANFTLPTQGEAGGLPSGTEHYYSFNYGDVHFVNLDSIDGTLSRSANTPMLQWLRQDLAAATQRWIIAYWHGGPYTKGSHDSDSTTDTLAWMVQMRENVVPVLESYGVDVVLNGHSHVYERTWPLHGHYGFSATFNTSYKVDPGDGKMDGTGPYRKQKRGVGTIYITAAVGGQPRNTVNSQHPAHLLKKTGILGSMVIDVDGNQLDFKYVNTSGGVEDYFTMIKDDSQDSPDLTISCSAGVGTVSWPASATGFDLQFSAGMSRSATWQTIINGIETSGESRVYQFVPAQDAPVGFFRLERR